MKKILLFVLLTLIVDAAVAQTRRKGGVARAPQKGIEAGTLTSIQTLIDEYKFDDASRQISTKLTQARRHHQDAEVAKLQEMAQTARVGTNMLSATAKVCFIDSIVADKEKVLAHITLAKSAGHLGYWHDYFVDNESADDDLKSTIAYTNDFGDKLFYCYPDETGQTRPYVRYKMGDKWSNPTLLEGIGDSLSQEINPYVLSDGMTVYFASKGEGGLGGYDIYVTRYNTDEESYLKPENMGMPFNSTANDYFLAIDEETNIGWLVTDRRQPEGKVCIYMFIPQESRENYDLEADNTAKVISLARINSIKASQSDAAAVSQALQRYRQMQEESNATSSQAQFRFMICNGIIYASLNQFKSSKARQLAQNWKELTDKKSTILSELSANRRRVKRETSLAQTIQKQEQAISQLDDALKDLAWNIRFEEQTKLGIKE